MLNSVFPVVSRQRRIIFILLSDYFDVKMQTPFDIVTLHILLSTSFFSFSKISIFFTFSRKQLCIFCKKAIENFNVKKFAVIVTLSRAVLNESKKKKKNAAVQPRS